MADRPDKCIIDDCDRVVECPESGLCKRCYAALYYWRKKSVTEIIRRKNKLKLFMGRMDVVEPKVVPLRTKRRASR
jgi:hypothetical protein